MHIVGAAFRQQFAYKYCDKFLKLCFKNGLPGGGHGKGNKAGRGTKEPVNMKQANLAQKDNLSQSQLLHTQNDRQMKTQAAGKQVKAPVKRGKEGGVKIFLMLLKHSSSGT